MKDGLKGEVKVEIEKLFKEILEDWLLKTNYFIEVSAMNPVQAEREALEQYRSWSKKLAMLLKDI